MAEQQKQIEELRLILLGQKKQIDSVTAYVPGNSGGVSPGRLRLPGFQSPT